MGIKYCLMTAAMVFTLPALTMADSLGVGNHVFSLGPRVIYSTPKDADSGQWSAGVQARIHMSLGLALEASMDSRSNNFNNSTTIKTWPFQVSLLGYLFPGAVLSPYLLGGAGWYYTQVDGPFSFNHTDSRFGMHAGVGIEFMINETIFREYDIRGKAAKELTEEVALAVGKAFGTLLIREGKKNIAIGHDHRWSAEFLYRGLSNGLQTSRAAWFSRVYNARAPSILDRSRSG